MNFPIQEDNDVIKNPDRGKSNFDQEELIPAYIKRGVNPIIPQDYPSLDGEPINAHIIDNNEYVGFDFGVKRQEIKNKKTNTQVPNMGEFILMVRGKIVCCGSELEIVSESKSILYGNHPDFGNSIKIDDIIVLKRIGLKVGVFLDD